MNSSRNSSEMNFQTAEILRSAIQILLGRSEHVRANSCSCHDVQLWRRSRRSILRVPLSFRPPPRRIVTDGLRPYFSLNRPIPGVATRLRNATRRSGANMSLLLTIFLLVFVAQLITWIGKSVLLDIAYDIYLRITRSPLAARQRALKTEILSTKAELLKTSAQDQFAKWAKLRRSVDKGLADLEKLNAEVAASKSGFSMKFNTLLWLLTTGLQFVVGWWYRKQPVFFLPEGWFGPLTWWLALPFAPAGSVSVGVWQMACKRVIVVGERVVKDFYGAGASQPEKVAVPSLAPTPNNTPRNATKKEKEK
ncbi:unnamed protein product [Cyclocybe aegerita]|uniref:Guided entry of tail-anchored proteins 1 n=1 Tax=Cyclocybe aegerita TaxID=1973307 RepID=A0A8S0W3B3_CYCAE|nr:unnamed protein product [Cyclocybe aegerita]